MAHDTNVSVLSTDRDLVNRGEVKRRIQALSDKSKDVDLAIAKQLELLGQEVDELRGASTGFANVAMDSLVALERRCDRLEALTLAGRWQRLRNWARGWATELGLANATARPVGGYTVNESAPALPSAPPPPSPSTARRTEANDHGHH